METNGEVKPNPIAAALKHWKPERFPEEDYERFWCWTFRDYEPELVAQAINALIMQSDPYSPTVDAVMEFMRRLDVRPISYKSERESWDRIAYEINRAEREKIQAQQDDDESICNAMSDATFETLARQEIAKFDPAVQSFRCYSPHRKVSDLRRSKHLTSLVAAHARAHGLVRGGLFQEAR